MGIFRNLSDNVVEVGVMTVAIVLISLLLINMKNQNISSSICPGDNASHAVYSSVNDTCCVAATNCGGANSSAISSLGTSINTSVTGVGTPITYIGIIILVLVFSAILVMLVKKLRNKT